MATWCSPMRIGLRFRPLNEKAQIKLNPDGTVDLYFGPKPPAGLESNWIPTGEDFFLWFRLYGPLGAFETKPFDNGTVEVAEAAAELASAGKLIALAGGGDTVAALHAASVAERFTYVSTAGGAFLEWLEGKTLPGIEVLKMK